MAYPIVCPDCMELIGAISRRYGNSEFSRAFCGGKGNHDLGTITIKKTLMGNYEFTRNYPETKTNSHWKSRKSEVLEEYKPLLKSTKWLMSVTFDLSSIETLVLDN